MLKEIRIQNFKSLKDTGYLEIKPITIFIGPNNSGKSSVIQFLLLLKQTVESPDSKNPLIYTEPNCLQLESYENIIWKKDPNNNLTFEFSFDKLTPSRGIPPMDDHIRYETHIEQKNGMTVVSSFNMFNRENNELILSVERNDSGDAIIKKSIFSEEANKILSKTLAFIHFYPGFCPHCVNECIGLDKKSAVLKYHHYIGRLFSGRIFYQEPLREFPQRYYPIPRTIIDTIGFKGEKAVQVLAIQKEIMNDVSRWMKTFGLGSISLNEVKKSVLAELIFREPTLGIDVNLYDVGFGASQILPIIVEGFHAPAHSLITIEQPEIHLHPKLQAEMGDLLIDIARTSKKLIIETHSEHLLLRIQRRIVEGSLKKEDVAIYYFNLTDDGTKITRMKFDEDGKVENWPKDFFEEDLKETAEITEALIKRAKK